MLEEVYRQGWDIESISVCFLLAKKQRTASAATPVALIFFYDVFSQCTGPATMDCSLHSSSFQVVLLSIFVTAT